MVPYQKITILCFMSSWDFRIEVLNNGRSTHRKSGCNQRILKSLSRRHLNQHRYSCLPKWREEEYFLILYSIFTKRHHSMFSFQSFLKILHFLEPMFLTSAYSVSEMHSWLPHSLRDPNQCRIQPRQKHAKYLQN